MPLRISLQGPYGAKGPDWMTVLIILGFLGFTLLVAVTR